MVNPPDAINFTFIKLQTLLMLKIIFSVCLCLLEPDIIFKYHSETI